MTDVGRCVLCQFYVFDVLEGLCLVHDRSCVSSRLPRCTSVSWKSLAHDVLVSEDGGMRRNPLLAAAALSLACDVVSTQPVNRLTGSQLLMALLGAPTWQTRALPTHAGNCMHPLGVLFPRVYHVGTLMHATHRRVFTRLPGTAFWCPSHNLCPSHGTNE